MVLKVSPDVVDIRVFCCLFVVCTNVASKHTLPRLARSTLNELQQNQHEKASLVCVRVQNPSGLALAPCALSMGDLRRQFTMLITHTSIQNKCFVLYFWYPMLVGPVMSTSYVSLDWGCFFSRVFTENSRTWAFCFAFCWIFSSWGKVPWKYFHELQTTPDKA